MTPRKQFDEDDDDGIFKRHKWLLPVIALVAIGGAGYAASQFKGGPSAPSKPPERMMVISLPPPPPPPPPVKKPDPPPEPPKQKEDMTKIDKEEIKDKPPEAPKPKDEPPPAALATGIKGGSGPDMGLASSGNGLGGGNGTIGGGNGGRGGSEFGRYAAQVQSRVADALRGNGRVRTASLTVEARIWVDANGRIERARLAGSSGDSALDREIADGVLSGLQLPSAPPAGMKMPITMRITARKN